MSSATHPLLLPSPVDELARCDPSRVLYSFAKTRNPADGFRDVSAAEFSRAVDRCSWFIQQSLGRGINFPTLLYMGPQDLTYAILTLACIKTGYVLLLSSHRNTLEAHISLLDQTDCHIFLSPAGFPLPVVAQLVTAKSMRHVEIPGLHEWLAAAADDEEEEEKRYPFEKSFSEAWHEPFATLHTSGTTGLPKAVLQSHGTVSALHAFSTMEEPPTTFPAISRGKRVYVAFPLFHSGGLHMLLPGCLYGGITVVLGPFPPSADIVNSVHVHGDVQASELTPTTIIELTQNPEYLENLGRLDLIAFGGGPCPKAIGDVASSKTRLINCLGSTEGGILPCRITDDLQDWPYLRLHPILGHHYRHAFDHLYEHVIVRDESRRAYQGVFATFPDLTEWPMRDLYAKHPDPTKDDLWLYHGRADDIIVFANGEKLHAIDMEDMINANPAVSHALVAGHGRFQSSLLVEAVNPPADTQAEKELLELVWPSVLAANKISPSHGSIFRHMIIFTSPVKPMLRAAKGTVQRKKTLELYASGLDSLYEKAENEISNHRGRESHRDRPQSVGMQVKNIVATCTSFDMAALPADVNLFDMGMNSLHVLEIARDLNEFASLHGITRLVKPATIYANPTLAALIEIISTKHDDKGTSDVQKSPGHNIEQLYQEYALSLVISGRPAHSSSAGLYTVLLTGSTGSLGSYILDVLQKSPQVSKIYCLCRGVGASARQVQIQASRALQPLTSKVQIVGDVSLSRPYFGLSLPLYKELLGSVTHIVHNAWKIDFNLSVDSFTSHIRGVQQLANFSATSRLGARLFFVSSIGSVSGLAGHVLENVYSDVGTPEASGYGQSKFIAERILDRAAQDADVPCTICRVGQVAGPTSEAGGWSEREWFPSLIRSSQYLGKLPAFLGRLDTIDWLPVDILANVLAYATVYHAANPHTTSWNELVPSVMRNMGGDGVVETVPLQTWVDILRHSAAASGVKDVHVNPAAKLIDFYDSLTSGKTTTLDTERSQAVSKRLSEVGPIRPEWMDNWMRQWGF
ncbi:hypothetical protein F4778DRAFT_798143 [Xylariomycetidae sp. FL2044]|nr:hypothetical protein F4778DRAFT_798143 [Xylariomycetidae sp. FL2044]